MSKDFARPSRRSLAAAGLLLGLPKASVAATAPALMRDVETFTAFGAHRCGGDAEAPTADWVLSRLTSLGYQGRTHSFPICTILEPGGVLTIADRDRPAFPQWLCPPVAFQGPVQGRLRPLSSAGRGDIAVLDAPFPAAAYWRGPQKAAVLAARAAGAQALLIAAADPAGGLFTFNQDETNELLLPVANLAPSALSSALTAAAASGSGRLVLRGRPTEASGLYVAVTKGGVGEAIVVSTPLTGWFRCGAERGPGVALLLSLAQGLKGSRRPVHLLATGGHELGHLGMKAALQSPTAPPKEVALWLHLGAGVGASALDGRYGAPSQKILTVSKDLAALAARALPNAEAWTRLAPTPQSPGEAGDVVAAGYGRMIGLAGAFAGFHTPDDTGAAIDPVQLGAIGEGLARLLTSLG